MVSHSSLLVLGRHGDVINALPIAWEAARIHGPQDFIIAQEFASVLTGCSYVNPVIYPGSYADVQGAVKMFQTRYSEIRIAQPWSSNWPMVVLGDSFARSAWAQLGRRGWPGRLVFDRRDAGREARLLETLRAASPGESPILVALDSTSSPFPHRRELLDSLKSAFGQRVWTLEPLAHRIYDLLGLFERAAALVTVDTMALHLSWAVPRLPVIALIADTPTLWHGTACRPNQAFRCRYKEYPAQAQALVAAVGRALVPRSTPVLIHCWSEYERKGGAKDRHQSARQSWMKEFTRCPGQWAQRPTMKPGQRFDHRELHPVRDILDRGCAETDVSDDDLLVLTNDDVGFVPGITDSLLEVAHWPLPAAYAHRMDVDRSDGSLTSAIDGAPYPGVDLFAIGVKLWKQWRNEFPDCVLGAEQWDLAMLALMRRVGAVELPGVIWHQAHSPGWVGPNAHKANQHNRRACGLWFAKQGITADQVIEGLV